MISKKNSHQFKLIAKLWFFFETHQIWLFVKYKLGYEKLLQHKIVLKQEVFKLKKNKCQMRF